MGHENETVLNLTYNSKNVTENTLFICKGAAFKEAYLEEAAKSGAFAYISEKKYDVNLPYIIVSDIRTAMPILADLYFCRPWEDLNLIGITGTRESLQQLIILKPLLMTIWLPWGGRRAP